ncbi:hypothetical protein BKA70DRAFT_1236416 [Coprinopsis sp. MPI-PUGE-AT-0042]|nr:hypothetical protein BKA70DRAFT_1236416 [Coprinopsis sp. MPI-PUGE-AT-0042]
MYHRSPLDLASLASPLGRELHSVARVDNRAKDLLAGIKGYGGWLAKLVKRVNLNLMKAPYFEDEASKIQGVEGDVELESRGTAQDAQTRAFKSIPRRKRFSGGEALDQLMPKLTATHPGRYQHPLPRQQPALPTSVQITTAQATGSIDLAPRMCSALHVAHFRHVFANPRDVDGAAPAAGSQAKRLEMGNAKGFRVVANASRSPRPSPSRSGTFVSILAPSGTIVIKFVNEDIPRFEHDCLYLVSVCLDVVESLGRARAHHEAATVPSRLVPIWSSPFLENSALGVAACWCIFNATKRNGQNVQTAIQNYHRKRLFLAQLDPLTIRGLDLSRCSDVSYEECQFWRSELHTIVNKLSTADTNASTDI